MTLPLQGLRIVELGVAVAGPFATSLLSDFGAEVIKVEEPGRGDNLRYMGPSKNGVALWWAVAGRNKKSVTIDIRAAEGQRLVRELAARSDVLVENFRPGVLERHNLGWEELVAVQPNLVMLRVSGFGQTGPYASRPGFGKIAESFSGATNLTGSPDSGPIHPGYSLADLVTGMTGAFGILMALYAVKQGVARGQVIDLALYEPLLRMIEWQVPIYQQLGWVPQRNGPRFPFGQAFLTNICRTSDDAYIVVSAATEPTVARVINLLVAEGVLPAPIAPLEDVPRVSTLLESWIRRTPAQIALARLKEFDIATDLIYTVADICANEHIQARENLITVRHAELGEVTMPAPVPRFSSLGSEVKWAGPRLGEHTDEVLDGVLGMSQAEIARLRSAGVL